MCRPAFLQSSVYLLRLQFWLVQIEWESAAVLSVRIFPGICEMCKLLELSKDLVNLTEAYEWNPAFCSIDNIIEWCTRFSNSPREKLFVSCTILLIDPWEDLELLFHSLGWASFSASAWRKASLRWLSAQPCFCISLISLFRGSQRNPKSHAFACLSYWCFWNNRASPCKKCIKGLSWTNLGQ